MSLSLSDHPDDMLLDAEAVAAFLANILDKEPEALSDKGWAGLQLILVQLADTIRAAMEARAAQAA